MGNTINPKEYTNPTRWSYADTDGNDWKDHILKDSQKMQTTWQMKPGYDLMPSDPGYYHEIEKAPPSIQ